MRPYLKKTLNKKGCGVPQDVGPEFKLWYWGKKRKGKKERKTERKDILLFLLVLVKAEILFWPFNFKSG
jgi:hypothetical protein